MEYNPIENWLQNIALENSGSKGTYDKYKRNLEQFLKLVGKSAEEILEEYEDTTDRKFKRKYARMIKVMTAQMSKEGYAGSSINCTVSAIKSFFRFSDLPLGYTPTANDRVVYRNRDIRREEIGEILKQSKPREQAFFSIMAQSGLRPSTICMLQIKDVEGLSERNCSIPTKITVSEEKTKGKYKAYFSFMGKESVEYVLDYLKSRKHVEPNDFLFMNLGETEPLNRGTMGHAFKRVADKLCKSGTLKFEIREGKHKPSELRMYGLRKFFRKMAGHAGYDYVHYWMGHSLKRGQDESYFHDDENVHRQKYKQHALPNLRISMKTPTETELEITDMQKTIQHQQKEINALKTLLTHAKEPRVIEKPNPRVEGLERLMQAMVSELKGIGLIWNMEKMEFEAHPVKKEKRSS